MATPKNSLYSKVFSKSLYFNHNLFVGFVCSLFSRLCTKLIYNLQIDKLKLQRYKLQIDNLRKKKFEGTKIQVTN